MATLHTGDMLNGCTECADRNVGIVIDGSHWSAYDLDLAVTDYAIRAGLSGVRHNPVAFGDDPVESARWDAETALNALNDACPDGYVFVIDDNSLYFEKCAYNWRQIGKAWADCAML